MTRESHPSVPPPERPLRVLRLLMGTHQTSAPYNNFTLATVGRQETTLCTFTAPQSTPPRGVRLIAGNGSVRAFAANVKLALQTPHDVLHCHSPYLGALLALLHPFKRGLPPTVFTVHCCYSNYKLKHVPLMALVFSWFEEICYCSAASAESIPAWLRALRRRPGVVTANGVDLTRVDRVLETDEPVLLPFAPPRGVFCVTALGRLVDVKNYSVLLQAFARGCQPPSELQFLGDGPLRPRLEAEARALGIADRVHFRGMVPRDVVFRALAATDLLVMTSHTEGLSVAVLEALACQTPVLLSDIPSHREIAAGAEFIPLAPPHDVAAFAREMARYEQMSHAARRAIGIRGRRLAEERFSLRAMHQRYETVYRQLMAQRSAA